MMHKRQKLIRLSAFAGTYGLLMSSACADDLPLTIEELLTDESSFRLEIGGIFATTDSSDVQSLFQTIEIVPGQFIDLPVLVGEARQNNDFYVLSAGLRYGWSAKTEIFGRLTGVVSDTRATFTDGTTFSNSDERISDLTVGISHQFLDDAQTPALLGFADVSLVENTSTDGFDATFVKSGSVGLTTYRSIDPIVLSLTAGYRYSAERRIDDRDTDPGDLFFLTPSVAFAVNNEVTLSGGVQLRFRGKDEVDGVSQGTRTTSTELELGLAYTPVDHWSLRFDVGADISGDTGSEVGFTLLYKFGS